MNKENLIWGRTVMNTETTWRRVYYSSENNRQIAVVVRTCSPFGSWGKFRVCLPHEHAGWSFQCSDIRNAERYIARQCTKMGRFANALQFRLANKRLVPPGAPQ